MAIFYRANSQSRLLEDYLRKHDIPYRVVGGTKFYDRKEIKDILSYLRIIVNDKDSLALSRVINTPSRGVGAMTLRKLEEESIRTGGSLWETLERIVEHPEECSHLKIGAKVKSGMREFVNLIHEGKAFEQQKVNPSEIFEKVLHDSGYWSFLKSSKDYESLARLENLDELENAIKQFESGQKNPSLLGFLETITLDNNAEEKTKEQENLGEVSLMTIHGAKGLEFNYVFLVGAEENIFPSFMSLESGEMGLEEERRLFYVAMTRAMKKLYICFAQGRMVHGQIRFNGPSRFIYEIPEKYYCWKKEGGKVSESDHEDFDCYDGNFGQHEKIYQIGRADSLIEKNKIKKAQFPKGIKIQHALYGNGVVIGNHGFGTEEKVTIEFKGGEKKKFMVKFAPLKKL
jgi:DNA helicase-2/ATP-dependent DNA helicase PcrA